MECAALSECCREASLVVEREQVYQSDHVIDEDATHSTTLINYCFIDHIAPMTIDLYCVLNCGAAAAAFIIVVEN